jgi:hypothetical protein
LSLRSKQVSLPMIKAKIKTYCRGTIPVCPKGTLTKIKYDQTNRYED